MKPLTIIGVPLDLGSGRRGVDMGPSAVRVADLNRRLASLGYEVMDAGDVPVSIAETLHYGEGHSKFLKEILLTCEHLARLVEETLGKDHLPIVLGGDHSIALGTLAGVARHFHAGQQTVGLIWFDAHADFNTPQSSPSGNVHGMPLAASVGVGPKELTQFCGVHPTIKPQNAVLVGVRDIDPEEKELLASSAVRVFTMRDIDERGMRSVVEEAIRIASQHTAGLAVSWDMDFLDPAFAPGVGTPVKGGASYREAHLAMEM
ncbi:MAG: arginase, partial [Acidobacteria bacterium]|nr:arginase [Acidobacteriota bacterium]